MAGPGPTGATTHPPSAAAMAIPSTACNHHFLPYPFILTPFFLAANPLVCNHSTASLQSSTRSGLCKSGWIPAARGRNHISAAKHLETGQPS